MSESTAGRKPWVAVALSLVSTGLGHVYCGRIVSGLVLFCASLLFAPVAVTAALMPPRTAVLIVLLVAALGVIGLYLYAAADAWRVARAALREGYQPRDCNRATVYLLMGAVGLIYPAGAAAHLRAHVFEAFLVPSASMVPTILDGDRMLVNKLTGSARQPVRGDVVVFSAPGDVGRNWVQRVIGLPGDSVEVRKGEVFVNGRKLPRDRVPAAYLTNLGEQARGDVYEETNAGRRYRVALADGAGPDFAKKTVPEGSYFVLGDNRGRSRDSRDFGFVPRGEVLGVVQYIYLPAESWGRFGVLTGGG